MKSSAEQLQRIIGEAERRAALPARIQPTPDRYPVLSSARQRTASMVIDRLGRLGVDLADIEALQQQHHDELRRHSAEAKRQTVEQAGKTAERLSALVGALRAPLDSMSGDLLGPGSELLLEVDFIRSWTNSDNLLESHQEPGLNWARYAIKDSGSAITRYGQEKVSFYIVWKNPRAETVLVDISVRLTCNGHCACDADGGGVASWFFPDSRCTAEVSARLTLWGLWSQTASQVIVDTKSLATVRANGGFFGDGSSTSISAAPAVSTSGFAVPGDASILIEASIAVDYELLNGSLEADFASSGLGVGFAYGVVTVPPPMMVNG